MRLYFSPSRKLAAERLEKGGPRIYDPRERLLLSVLDRGLSLAAPLAGLRPRRTGLPDPRTAVRVLALRLDRLGDLVMTLPALAALRNLLPQAEMTLAVGRWNEDLARGLPFVDRVELVDLPSSAWGRRASWREAARNLQAQGQTDLALDFQGDVRSLFLMALTRATLRAGYADTGGRVLLTHVARWDEHRSWYRQSFDLLETVFPQFSSPTRVEPYNFLLPEDRKRGAEILRSALADGARRPFVGIHPSAGRRIKQWETTKLAALADRLGESSRGTIVLTGAESDRALVEAVAGRAASRPETLVGKAGVRAFSGVLAQLDLFVTGDTGPMHLAHAVGAPTLAIFGPSDPFRYGPEGESPRRAVVRERLYCSPCNMIRKPPRECSEPEAPECLSTLSVEKVMEAALRLLRSDAQ